MKLEELKIGMKVLIEMGDKEPRTLTVLKLGKIQVRVGNEEGGASWVYPYRLTSVEVPPGCEKGMMINQNMPDWLRVGFRVDSNLPPGTMEFWKDGKRMGRIENIGVR